MMATLDVIRRRPQHLARRTWLPSLGRESGTRSRSTCAS